jgi:LCP family protein required for cell wall assembly
MVKHKTKQKSLIRKLVSKRILLFIQLVTSVIFAGLLYLTNFGSAKYQIPIAVALVILWFIMLMWMRSGVKNKKQTGSGVKLTLSKLVSILLSILLIVGSRAALKGNSIIDIIGNAFEETHNINVYVLENSTIEEIEDVEDSAIGISYREDLTYIGKGVLELEKDIGDTELIESDDNVALADALYNGDVDCIVADEAFMSLLEANHENFEAETRIIKTYPITEKIKTETSNTDVTEEPFVLYVTGIDTYGDISTVSRSDVNLVLVVNPVEKQILMVSIPRDTQVDLASNGEMDKLTHTGQYGIDETLNTIEGFLKVDFDYYVKTNFTGMVDIIDQLGGVTIDSPYEDFVTLHGNYTITNGINEMDGDKALCFVRERYSLPLGDIDRGKNQQLLLKAILKKAMSPKIITNYSNILDAVGSSMETNMSSDSIHDLINMQLDDMSSWEIYNAQVTGVDEKALTYSMPNSYQDTIIPDKDLLKEIIKVIDKVEAGKKISEKDLSGLE